MVLVLVSLSLRITGLRTAVCKISGRPIDNVYMYNQAGLMSNFQNVVYIMYSEVYVKLSDRNWSMIPQNLVSHTGTGSGIDISLVYGI
jgi:hypothetical protein